MIEFFAAWLLFLIKLVSVLAFIAAAIALVAFLGSRARRHQSHGRLEVRKLNDTLEHMQHALDDSLLDPAALKERQKARHKEEKLESKAARQAEKRARKQRGKGETRLVERGRKRIFVLDFDGDIRAEAVDQLRQEITAILESATTDDEVLLRLESGGGVVHGYGLGASQLSRLREAKIPLTVAVDKVAASGGYMMACVSDRLLAAPFALIGSIGVVAQIPNIHRLLKKNDVDVELITAGKYKRTLTVLGENTEEGREKFRDDLERIHQHFKDHIRAHRPELDVDAVSTGEVWLGQEALSLKLVDGVQTSDDWLYQASKNADVLELRWDEKKPLSERLPFVLQRAADALIWRWMDRAWQSRLPGA